MATMTMTKRERGAKSMDGGEAWVRQLPNAQHITSVIAPGTIILCDWNIFMHFVNDRQCLFGIIASALLLTAITVRDLDRVSKEPKNVQFTFLRRSQFKDHWKYKSHDYYVLFHFAQKYPFLSVNIFALRWDYYLDTQQIFWHQSHFNYLVSS